MRLGVHDIFSRLFRLVANEEIFIVNLSVNSSRRIDFST